MLKLVGDGPDRAALEAQVDLLGLGNVVTFLGYRSQDEVAELLAEASALVLPSFAEGVPVVLMEAMAAGIPVVTTTVAGISELVEDGVSGRLVAPGEEEAFAQAIVDVTASADTAARMGAAGRDRVRSEFNLKAEAPGLARLVTWARTGGPRPSRRPMKVTS
jgi:glycosyltransferase involved in cell wall biosynthesis